MDNNTKEFPANPSTTNGKQLMATRDYFKCTSSIQEAGSFTGHIPQVRIQVTMLQINTRSVF